MAFNAAKKMPDVYFEEVEVPGSIAGVATGIVGVVGPARQGRIGTPVLVTNFTQFQTEFGAHLMSPRYFASHAINGFFANGGQFCYFVRVSNAARASLDLNDRSAGMGLPTLAVEAKQEGAESNGVQIAVAGAASLGSTTIKTGATTLSAAAVVGATQISVTNASDLAPFDTLLLDDGGGTTENATIARIETNTVHLASALANPFANGDTVRIADIAAGTTAAIRVVDTAGIEAGSYITLDDTVNTENLVVDGVDATNHILTLRGTPANSYSLAAGDPPITVVTQEFDLTVTPTSGAPVTYAQLSIDARHSRYFAGQTGSNANVEVTLIDTNPTAAPDNMPRDVGATPLAGGLNDVPETLTSTEYRAAIDALQRAPDVTMVCVPDRVDKATQDYLVAHCEAMQDRFAILDPTAGASVSAIKTQRSNLQGSDRGYGAIYYPRVIVPEGDDGFLMPPSGHIAGVFARTDDDKGVWKAPANESILGVLGLEQTLTETEAGDLNEEHINVLRKIRNRGHRIWGARTLAASTQWRYVNVRRLMLYIEESVRDTIRLHVFAPNNLPLWKTIKRQVDAFLTQTWQEGALYGASPEEGFQVRIDEELNPASQIALGILTVEVRLRPNPPAEYIVFRIIQSASTSLTEEL